MPYALSIPNYVFNSFENKKSWTFATNDVDGLHLPTDYISTTRIGR